jgi:hypothetical protein
MSMFAQIKNRLGLVRVTAPRKKYKETPASKPANKATLTLDEFEKRENPAAGFYVGFGAMAQLDGNLFSATSQHSPGIAIEVAPVFGAEKAFVALGVEGLGLHLQMKGSPLTVEVGTYGIDGFDYYCAVLCSQAPGPNGKINVNDAVLLPPGSPSPATLFAGAGPNDPVNQPPGPYGNGSGPFGP